MPIRNPNWYNLQSSRRYPLDDTASGTDDGGTRIVDSLLVDCHLRWPASLGQYAYIGGITVTDSLVTVVILAAGAVDATIGFVPLAAVSLAKPVEQHIHYSVDPMVPGVGGFLVFGDIRQDFVGRFSSPAQSLLLPRCASPYEELPIPSLRKKGNAVGLADLVLLKAGTDIVIAKETHEISGHDREAIVLRLKKPTAGRNTLDLYRGPCDTRPESHTCFKDGIERINNVLPDADGNITITFENMTEGPYESCGAGITLDQSLGIADVCVPPLYGAGSATDSCAAEPSSSSSASAGAMFFEAGPVIESLEEIEDPRMELPYSTSLANEDCDGFHVQTGTFSFHRHAGATYYVADSIDQRNISLVCSPRIDDSVPCRFATTAMIEQSAGKANAMLILNYHRRAESGVAYDEYFAVSLDRQLARARLLRFNGSIFVEEHGVTIDKPIVYGHEYRLEAEIVAAEVPGSVVIAAKVSCLTDPSWPEITFSALTGRYLPADGRFGVGSDRASAGFATFTAEVV